MAYTIKIWDTAGQERFKTLTQSFYKKADGVVMAYDVTDRKSFENIRGWIDSINKHATVGIPKILVGNKIDLEDDRIVSTSAGEEMAAGCQGGLAYFETSAKLNQGITECFEHIFEKTISFKFSPDGGTKLPDRKSVMLNQKAHVESVKNRASAVNGDGGQSGGGCC